MRFRQFMNWCNERAADGKWPLMYSLECLAIIDNMYDVALFRRRKVWKEEYEKKATDLVERVENMYRKEKE